MREIIILKKNGEELNKLKLSNEISFKALYLSLSTLKNITTGFLQKSWILFGIWEDQD